MYCLFVVSCYGQNIDQLNVLKNDALMEYTAHYDVYRKGDKHGKAFRTLSRGDNALYTLTFKTDASIYFYSINTEESSQFLYENNQIKPIKYLGKDERTMRKTRNKMIEFDYAKGVVLGRGKETEWSLPLETNIFDPLLVIEKMRYDIQNKIQRSEYFVYDKHSVKKYLFEYSGRETIKTPMGDIDTLKVSRVRENSSRKTHFWLSVEHNYIPFRVKQENNSKEVATLELTKLLIPSIKHNS
jgi:hypothetical protein